MTTPLVKSQPLLLLLLLIGEEASYVSGAQELQTVLPGAEAAPPPPLLTRSYTRSHASHIEKPGAQERLDLPSSGSAPSPPHHPYLFGPPHQPYHPYLPLPHPYLVTEYVPPGEDELKQRCLIVQVAQVVTHNRILGGEWEGGGRSSHGGGGCHTP